MRERPAQRFYRPELDVVRFVAFVFVFLSHALPAAPTVTASGAFVRSLTFGLSLFFFLSAFLITKLLLIERQRTSTINLANFYKRRALRIWPLYLVMLFGSAFFSILRHTFHVTALWYAAALLMLANAVWWIRTTVSHLWSISIEEQFYLLWPAAVKRLSRPMLITLAGSLMVVANAVLAFYGFRHTQHDGRIWANTFVQMEFFAAGILVAMREATLRSMLSSALSRVCLFAAALLFWWIAVRVLHALGNPGEACMGPFSLCAGYVLGVAGCCMVLLSVEGKTTWPKPLIYLGKISYGLYAFHPIALNAGEHFLLPRYGRLVSVAFSFLFAVSLAALSYRVIESPFLRWKERFEIVTSRPVDA